MPRSKVLERRLLKAVVDPKHNTMDEVAAAAGLSPTGRSIHRPAIKKLFKEHFKMDEVTLEDIQAKFKSYEDLAISKGDLANANRATENRAKTIGAFIDKSIVDQTTTHKMSKEDDEELSRLRSKIHEN